jgi:serine/threonine protein kinase
VLCGKYRYTSRDELKDLLDEFSRNTCQFISNAKLNDDTKIGSGGHGSAYKILNDVFEDMGKEIVIKKMDVYEFDKIYDVDESGFEDSEIVEYIATNYIFDKLGKLSPNFYCMKSLSICEIDGTKNFYAISPLFAGDLKSVTINDESYNSSPYNQLFIFFSVLHAIYLIQEYLRRCMHRDIKPENIFMDPIENYQSLPDKIDLDFGDGMIISFDKSKLKYIPKIGDWGLASIGTSPIPIKTRYSYESEWFGGRIIGAPDKYNKWFDPLFFTLRTCTFGSANHNFSKFNIRLLNYITNGSEEDYDTFSRFLYGHKDRLWYNNTYDTPVHKTEYDDKSVKGFIEVVFHNYYEDLQRILEEKN